MPPWALPKMGENFDAFRLFSHNLTNIEASFFCKDWLAFIFAQVIGAF